MTAQVYRLKSIKAARRSAVAAERGMAREITRAQKKARRGEVVDETKRLFVTDSFQNFALGLGMGTDNALSQSTYGYNPITRIRVLLEWIHRGSWLGGVAVDVVADDMTRAGIDVTSTMAPDDVEGLQKGLIKGGVWTAYNETVRWSRLYGGAIAVMMIDGHDMETPLKVDRIAPGQFQGLLVLDRWLVQPDLSKLVFSPEHGIVPAFYDVPAGTMGLGRMRIHYSRVLRMEGVRLPYQQRLTEMLWGLSVYERLYDRMIAFDSATTGAAQLVYKSYLRYIKIENLKEIAAAGGDALQGLVKYVDMMRRFQGLEGVTMIDGKDEFGIQQSQAFSGISDVLLQFGQQLSGALQIPLVRLFGQSPAGLNSSGESDLRTYYDGINAQQEKTRTSLERIIRVVAASEEIELPENFHFVFKPLWQLTDEQKAEVASKVTETVVKAVEGGIVSSPALALKELRKSSRTTGIWDSITEEDIEEAENAAPLGEPPEVDPATGEPVEPAPEGAEGGDPNPTAAPGAGAAEREEPAPGEKGGGPSEGEGPESGGGPPRHPQE